MRRIVVVLALIGSLLAACKTGGEYVKRDGRGGRTEDEDDKYVRRGEVNGRVFDFVSNKAEGDDWQVRIRGSSIWASYSNEDSSEELKTKTLSDKESNKVWELIDALDIPSRKKGKVDEDEGFVQLRLREPGGEDGHDIYTVYVSRATEDDDVIALAEYLQTMIQKYHKEKPNF